MVLLSRGNSNELIAVIIASAIQGIAIEQLTLLI